LNKNTRSSTQGAFLTLSQERDLISRWQVQRDGAALSELLDAYSPFVRSMAMKHDRKKERQSDLMNEAFVSIIEALSSYTPMGTIRFLSYARSFVKSAMIDARQGMDLQIDIPRHAFGSGEDIDQALGTKVRAGLLNAVNILDIEDTVPAGQDYCPHECVLQKQSISYWRQHLEDAIWDLPDDERSVMAHRLQGSDQQIKDIANKVGISVARARALEGRAMMRLRSSLSEQGFSISQIEEA